MYAPVDDVMFVQVRDGDWDVDTSVQPPHQLQRPRHDGVARLGTGVLNSHARSHPEPEGSDDFFTWIETRCQYASKVCRVIMTDYIDMSVFMHVCM